MTEGSESAFDSLDGMNSSPTEAEKFEMFILLRRGKQHIHAGTVFAGSAKEAMNKIKSEWSGKPVFNIWAIPTKDFRFTEVVESDLWQTLPEKKFRDAADYKGGDKLKQVVEKQKLKL